MGLPLLLIDTFNNASADRHIAGLERFDPSVAVGPLRDGWAAARPGRF